MPRRSPPPPRKPVVGPTFRPHVVHQTPADVLVSEVIRQDLRLTAAEQALEAASKVYQQAVADHTAAQKAAKQARGAADRVPEAARRVSAWTKAIQGT